MTIKMNKDHECDFHLDFDGNIICYVCFEMNYEATRVFWDDYKSGKLKK